MDEDDSIGYWKTNLLELQEKAPKPKMVRCQKSANNTAANQHNTPDFYGPEFHGFIERAEAEKMLFEAGEGAFLVRASTRSPGAFTLCILFDGVVLNYKLYYDGAHYVYEKRFDKIETLVQDGLICMYVEKHASEYIKRMADEAIYEQSPYSQYNNTHSTDLSPPVAGKKRQIARSHNFSPFTFKMPHYCDFCRNFLWGLVQQGVRCTDCGFSAHRKCSEKAHHDCLPEAKYVKRMFAVDLTTLCLAHGVRVPPPLLQCIEEVERRGLTAEGIYRVSGSYERIDRLRRQYDLAHTVELAQEEDIHTVAGLLKLYLRLLPQQLVPFSVFRSLLKAYTNSKETLDRVRNCRSALEELSEANRNTLRVLLAHLRKVAEYSAENKMSPENLATIFSPTIFCTGNVPALPNQQHVLLHFLIVNKNILPAH